MRPVLEGDVYPCYVDGEGWRSTDARDAGYCPVCNPKNYEEWERRIRVERERKRGARAEREQREAEAAVRSEQDRRRAAALSTTAAAAATTRDDTTAEVSGATTPPTYLKGYSLFMHATY
jgi:hypothetical protein